MDNEFFRFCSTCRAKIAFGAKYYVCSVSSCNRGPVAVYFCSVPCWDAHVPGARHRDAWAEEATAPSGPAPKKDEGASERRRIVASAASSVSSPRMTGSEETEVESSEEVLVVVSKLKGFVKTQSGMSTSDGVFPVLSDHLRKLSVLALRSAAAVGRKTVLARDYEAVLRGDTAKD